MGKTGKEKAVVDLWGSVMTESFKNAVRNIREAAEAFAGNDFDHAIKLYEEAEIVIKDVRGNEDSHLSDIYEGLGNCYKAKGDVSTAQKYYKKAQKQ